MKSRTLLLVLGLCVVWLGASLDGVARETSPYNLRYPYQMGYLILPEDEGGHTDLSPDGGVEFWSLYGTLGTKEGERFVFTGKFWDLQFPWLDFNEAWGLEMPEQFTMNLANIETGEYYKHHTGVSIDNEVIDGSKLGVIWENSFIRSRGAFVYEVRMEDPENDVVVELDLQAVRYPLPAGWDGRVELTFNNEINNYTMTRLRASGTVTIQGVSHEVQGMLGMDHGWYGSNVFDHVDFLGTRDQYEWFAIQLSDYTDVVMWKIHNDQGNPPYIPAVSILRPDGSIDFYSETDFTSRFDRPTVDNLGSYESEETGLIYSNGWSVSLPESDIELTLTPYMPAQEISGNFENFQELSLYASHCMVTGISGKNEVSGYALVESTQYYSVPEGPSPIKNIRAESGNRQVVVSWEQSSDPDVVGYRLHLGTEPGVYDTFFDVANTNQFFINGLDNNMKYFFNVTGLTQRNRESFFGREAWAIPNDGAIPYVDARVDLPCFTGGDTITMSFNTKNPNNPAIPVDVYVFGMLDNGLMVAFTGDGPTPGIQVIDPSLPGAPPVPVSRKLNIPGRFDGNIELYSLPLDTRSVGTNLVMDLYVATVFDAATLPVYPAELLGMDKTQLCLQ